MPWPFNGADDFPSPAGVPGQGVFQPHRWGNLVNKLQTFARRAGVPVAAFAALVLSSGAHAAVDITAATTGISDAQTAVLGVLAAMITMAAAIFGVKKVLRLLGG